MGDENYGIDRGLIQDICLGFSVPEQLCDVRLLSVNYFFVKSSKSGGHLGFKCSESSLRMSVKSTYCAFHKHANSKVQRPPSQLRFWLPSIIITITSNEP